MIGASVVSPPNYEWIHIDRNQGGLKATNYTDAAEIDTIEHCVKDNLL
jgi:hypothetical protein